MVPPESVVCFETITEAQGLLRERLLGMCAEQSECFSGPVVTLPLHVETALCQYLGLQVQCVGMPRPAAI